MMLRLALASLTLATFIAACGTSGSDPCAAGACPTGQGPSTSGSTTATGSSSGAGAAGGAGGGAGGGTSATCFADTNCVADTDCVSGYHCNHAIQPPQCEKLYCGGEGTACSEQADCKVDLKCLGSKCVAMATCLAGGESCSGSGDCCNQNCHLGTCCRTCKEWVSGAAGTACNVSPVTALETCACMNGPCEAICNDFCSPFGNKAVPASSACLQCMQTNCAVPLQGCMLQ